MVQRTIKTSNHINLDIDNFIEQWNNKYPYDRWWRKKYNVSFGSELHKQCSFISMAIEYKEDMYFYKKSEEENEGFDEEVDNTKSTSGKKVSKMNKKEIDQEFNDLNLDDFNEK